jgi:hypothetical protein
MTIIEDRLALLEGLTLKEGKHDSFDDGVCLLELTSWLAGEPFTDHPQCVDPVLAAFGRSWNDALGDADRDRLLKPFAAKLIGTASTPDVQDARAFMAADWAVRVFTPAWLRLAGLEENAAELEGLKALASVALCNEAGTAIQRARDSAAAARAAAGDAAWDAAGAAAWDAAGAAARAAAGAAARAAAGAAAGAAAWDAARAAAWDAAGAAAWDAAGAAAWDAAGAAAGDAAWDAARAAAGAAAGDAAWDAARAAARAVLAPTVEALQTSAVDLFERMIALTPEVTA